MKRSSVTLYLCLGLVLLTWWSLAFLPLSSHPSQPRPTSAPSNSLAASAPVQLLPMDREALKLALLGDTERILTFMAHWDIEASLLESYRPKRLPRDSFLKAQKLGRRILAKRHGLPVPPERFLPQTYVAATFLLALAPAQQIVALPKGLREQTQLFPKALTDQVPQDFGPYHSEEIAAQHPDLAFVAPYTLPATRERLQRQGCALFTLSDLGTPEEIQQSLVALGTAAGHKEEAELLALFMEAALCALDNHLTLANPDKALTDGVLYLNYYTRFSSPTQYTLLGQLLQRLGIVLPDSGEARWQLPLEVEQISRLNPRTLILRSSDPKALSQLVLHHPALQQTPAVRAGRVYVMDEATQDTPTQLAVLAYYDLIQVLLEGAK